MKRLIKYFFLVIVILIFQISLINNIDYNYKTNFLVVMVIYTSQKFGWKSGFLLAFLLGFIYDILLGNRVGLTSISLIVVGISIGYISRYIFSDKIRYFFFYLILSLFLYKSSRYFIEYFIGVRYSFNHIIYEILSKESLYNFILLLYIHYLNLRRRNILEILKVERFGKLEV